MKNIIKGSLISVATCAVLLSLQGCGKDRAGVTPAEAKKINPTSVPGLNNANCGAGTNDTDCDYLTNAEEAQRGTDPRLADTDRDGLIDGCEVGVSALSSYATCGKTDPTKPDSDNDGLNDGKELKGFTLAPYGTLTTDPNNPDTDGDGLNDGDEVNNVKTNPKDPDTDHDGLKDGVEVHTYDTNATLKDTDGDMLSDGVEVNNANTDPKVADTDHDGVNDGIEICGTRSHTKDANGRIYETDNGITISDNDNGQNNPEPNFYNDKLTTLILTSNITQCHITADTKADAQTKTNDSDGDGRPNITEYNKGDDPLHAGSGNVDEDVAHNYYYPWITQTPDGKKMVNAGFVYVPKSNSKGFWMSKYLAVFTDNTNNSKVTFPSGGNKADNISLSDANDTVSNSKTDLNIDDNISIPAKINYDEIFAVKSASNGNCITIKNSVGDTNMPVDSTDTICELIPSGQSINTEFKSNGKVYIKSDGNFTDDGETGGDQNTHYRAATPYIQ